MSYPLWFGVEQKESAILRIAEVHIDPYAVGDMWLIQGERLCVLADAGSGIVEPTELVEGVATSPVVCVALTCSYDHAGGWHAFGRRACHPLDRGSLSEPAEENAAVAVYLTADRIFSPPYECWTSADYRMPGAEPTRLLSDGEILDLGDRRVEVLHTPGRSPGGLSLWEEATGTLFSGEMLYDGEHGPAWPPDDPAAYASSLQRVAALPVQVVHPGHYGSFDRQRMHELIDEQLSDLAARRLIDL